MINLSSVINKTVSVSFGNFEKKIFLENDKNFFEVVNSICEKEKIEYLTNVLNKNIFYHNKNKIENTLLEDNNLEIEEEKNINKVLIISKSKNYIKKIIDFFQSQEAIKKK